MFSHITVGEYMFRTGIGFDSHRLVQGRSLVLGGVSIEYELGLDGHSDADVLCHAIIDALLGALALGDIGHHFPDNDPKWKDAFSLDMLRHVGSLLMQEKFRVVNVDSTIIAEKPRMEKHIGIMRANIAETLGIDVRFVSVKAKTAERMGALGRAEGIAVMSVASLQSME